MFKCNLCLISLRTWVYKMCLNDSVGRSEHSVHCAVTVRCKEFSSTILWINNNALNKTRAVLINHRHPSHMCHTPLPFPSPLSTPTPSLTPNSHKQHSTHKTLNADVLHALSSLQLQQQSDCHKHRRSTRGIACGRKEGTSVTANGDRGEEVHFNWLGS
jgi:hypothetical protein